MFDKNLEAIDNLSLKRRLARVNSMESRVGMSYCITPSQDYVLLKDDVPIDDLNNPREAIKKHLESSIKNELKSKDIIINFGIGLGYLLDETFNRYPSRIYIYEPDLHLLHFVLSNVDISEHLSSGRVFITNELDELTNKLTASYLTQDRVEIVYLQNYAVVKNKEFLMLTQKVFDTCKTKMVDVNTITKFSKRWLMNSLYNMASINNGQVYLLSDLENKFESQTALIIGAGPSLNDNIAKIQANRDKFVIFAVNKVAKYLIQCGINPDFIVCLDAGNMEKTLGGLEGYLSKTNCIMDVRSENVIMTKGFHKVFINFSNTDFLMKKMAKYNSFMKFYESGGTASILALISAVKMGFSKVVLAGVDLAFKNNEVYSNGQTMQRISQDQIVVDYVKKNLVSVRSINGGLVQTRDDYQAFIHHFETVIKELKYDEIYNISSFGAHIEGVKPVKFEDLDLSKTASLAQVAFVQPFKFNVKEFMQDEFYHINNVISMISKGVFSTAMATSIVNSVLVYQYLQLEILNVLQKNFAPELAEDFIQKSKAAIKVIVETLQKTKLI